MTPSEREAWFSRQIHPLLGADLPERIGVAVSGGGDSMALLQLMVQLTQGTQMAVHAVTVNHGLRAEAAAEADFVARFCKDNAIPHQTLCWNGAAAQGNLQAQARSARYDLMADWARAQAIEHMVLGHTADDVAESLLMRLARKSGVDGLAAMDAVFHRHGVNWLRPLLHARRQDLRAYLTGQGLTWVEDPSNEDLTQTRPKARAVMSMLAPLGIDVDGLAQTGFALAQAKDALQHLALRDAQRVVTVEAGDVSLSLAADPPVHPETLRRLQIAAIQFVNRAPYPPRESALLNLEAALAVQVQHTVAGCLVRHQNGIWRFGREPGAVEGAKPWPNCQIPQIWDQRWRISADDGQSTAGDLTIRALGEGLNDIPDWRSLGLPRATLMASPAVWRGRTCIAAPIAGISNGFHASVQSDFMSFLLCR